VPQGIENKENLENNKKSEILRIEEITSTNQDFKLPYDSNKLLGMFYGVALGDALGVPTEFYRITPKMIYSPYINEIPFEIKFQFASIKVPARSVSDDTEMTIALLESIVSNNFNYNKDDVIKYYMKFANTCFMLGKNTRKLFKGIKTLNGYENRFNKLTDIEKENMQSNGSLMRATPLVLVGVSNIAIDTYLSNPNVINYYCNLIYIQILKVLLTTGSIDHVKEVCKNYINSNTTPEVVKKCLLDVLPCGAELNSNNQRDITGKIKGWVCSSLYISLYTLFHYDTFEEAMNFVIEKHPGSDTDTNASITGALFGAMLGLEKMKSEKITNKNIELLKDELVKFNKILKI
jgi:ADP-ribosyl-[dinitrogen reductase] hydrolase